MKLCADKVISLFHCEGFNDYDDDEDVEAEDLGARPERAGVNNDKSDAKNSAIKVIKINRKWGSKRPPRVVFMITS